MGIYLRFSLYLIAVTFVLVTCKLEPCTDPTLNCSVHHLPDGERIFVLQFRVESRISARSAESECRKLGQYPVEWHLPSPNHKQKHEALTKIILDNVNLFVPPDYRNLFFWIGLERNEVGSEGIERWDDPSKWRWSLDNTTLDSSFISGQVPWALTEPNHYMRRNQRCVYAHRNATNTIGWYDHGCDDDDYGYMPPVDVHVCESVTTVKVEESHMAIQSGTNHVKLGIGLTALVTVVLALILVVWYIRRRKFSVEDRQTQRRAQRYRKRIADDEQEGVLNGVNIFSGENVHSECEGDSR